MRLLSSCVSIGWGGGVFTEFSSACVAATDDVDSSGTGSQSYLQIGHRLDFLVSQTSAQMLIGLA